LRENPPTATSLNPLFTAELMIFSNSFWATTTISKKSEFYPENTGKARINEI
jgi:hypothetical protein